MPDLSLYIPFVLTALFLFEQSVQADHASPEGQVALNISSALGHLGVIVFLVLYGIHSGFINVVVLFFITLPSAAVAAVVIERLLSRVAIALIGFIGWPICLYLAFYNGLQ